MIGFPLSDNMVMSEVIAQFGFSYMMIYTLRRLISSFMTLYLARFALHVYDLFPPVITCYERSLA